MIVPLPDDFGEPEPIICQKCGKQYKDMNELLNSDCWYLDHESCEPDPANP